MAFRLSIEDGPIVQTLEVRSGALTVGKRPPVGLALSSPGLSSRHAVFRQMGSGVEVEALPTKIGVRLRGERIEREILAVGDTVLLGWARITVMEVSGESLVPATPAALATAQDTSSPFVAPEARVDAAIATSAAAQPGARTDPAMERGTAVDARVGVESGTGGERSTGVALASSPPRLPAEPAADYVVLSQRAVRVLPWWGISIALHALAFGAAIYFAKPPVFRAAPDDSMFAVTLREAPPRFEPPDVPVIEPSRRAVDVQRPDMAVVQETPDSLLPPSADPKGTGGTALPRFDDPSVVFDDAGGGVQWAEPAGSTAIGVGSGGRIGSGVSSGLDELFGKGDAGRANASAAGRLTGEPFTRALVNGLRLRTNETNVRIVRGDYDQGELTMDALGIKHGWITPEEIAREGIPTATRVVFWNCSGKPPVPRALTNLAQWVEEGGSLFTSDWAIELVLEKAFPGIIRPLREGGRTVMTPDETITFTIAPGKHTLLQGLPPEQETSRWWLEESTIPFVIEAPDVVEVLAQSSELERKRGSKYVAVTFKHGKGRVVHVIGHMFQKEGNLRGAYAMQRLLLNFLYQAIKGT